MNWRAIFRSRFFYLPAAMVVAILAWNLYVSTHSHGVITGVVTNADGTPAAGATVIFYERNITSRFLEKARATTDLDGVFRFEGNHSHQIRLDAIGVGGQRSTPLIRRLWFAAQDARIREVLVIARPKS
jgi:hypothetical protein